MKVKMKVPYTNMYKQNMYKGNGKHITCIHRGHHFDTVSIESASRVCGVRWSGCCSERQLLS